ncbi:helix-turn-helix domain-containing protein [Paraburkholderia rhizosphaerae]|uniref:Transcriptional regulator GlxA family with amidase domain n=1 Tax=Paraburkholderia rhizosphaerae TaxID=480658 RepID=A0A4V6QD02_9BURK|nr:helix-turn-helix domain-containing protein [Paraburkholderia rhizosphaerae]TDY42917.1 transcriptional regulator GlxA family with amidase domain [Paraburkholderia rhizosphaerae]
MTHAGTEKTGAGGLATGDCASRALCVVGIVLSEGFSLLGAGIIAEAFQLANEMSASTRGDSVRYRVRLLSLHGGSVTCSSSVQVWTDELDVRTQHGFDALFISGGGAGAARTGRLPAEPAAMSERLSASACVDTVRTTLVFDLPAAQADDRFDAVKSALTLVVRDHGLDVAREIAEQLIPGSSAKLMPLLGSVGATVADKVRRCAQWLRENCDRPISVSDAAQEAAMSERNFLRRFKLEMGSTPSEYLLQARLDMTCRLLAGTELPVDKIARRSGMGNGDHLAKIFRKRWSISPTEYRVRVRRDRDALSAVVAPATAAEIETRDFAF